MKTKKYLKFKVDIFYTILYHSYKFIPTLPFFASFLSILVSLPSYHFFFTLKSILLIKNEITGTSNKLDMPYLTSPPYTHTCARHSVSILIAELGQVTANLLQFLRFYPENVKIHKELPSGNLLSHRINKSSGIFVRV